MSLTFRWKPADHVGILGVRVYRSEDPIDLSSLPYPVATIYSMSGVWVDEEAEIGKTYHYLFSYLYNEEWRPGTPIEITVRGKQAIAYSAAVRSVTLNKKPKVTAHGAFLKSVIRR